MVIVNVMINISLLAQIQTLTLQPGPSDGKDALIRDDFPDTNFGNDVNITSNAWTVEGNPCVLRSPIRFDLTAIPATATILSATLSLYCNIYSGIYQLQYGDNESYLLRITENWDENSITWVNQPNTTLQSKVHLSSSTSETEDYPNIDVTLPVQEMVLDPSLNYGWMLQLVTEELYRSMVFASSDNSEETWRPKLVVIYRNCPGPEADFGYEAEMKQVNFTDFSSSATAWYWNFGDGYFSDLQNPVHEYAQFGKYYVCLQVEDSCGTDEYCDTVYACKSPDTKFVYSVTDHFVNFSDSSFEATSWFWSFGDGFYSEMKDPLHYFNEYGTYYVCLTSENICQQKTYCDSVIVKPNGIPNKSLSTLKVYPNPARDFIIVSGGQEYLKLPVSLEIIDQLGKIRKKEVMMTHSVNVKVDISDLPPGLYCIRAISDRVTDARNFLIY